MTIRFAAIGLTHSHINGQTDLLLAEGATLVSFWSDEEVEDWQQARLAERPTDPSEREDKSTE